MGGDSMMHSFVFDVDQSIFQAGVFNDPADGRIVDMGYFGK